MPTPSAANSGQRLRGRQREGQAQRSAHERRGAGRGHRDRQHAGQRGSRPADGAARSDASRSAARVPNSNSAGQVQPDQREQQRPARRRRPATAAGSPSRSVRRRRAAPAAARPARRTTARRRRCRPGRRRAVPRRSCAWPAKPSSLSDRIGNTQGIRFSSAPPTSANSSAAPGRASLARARARRRSAAAGGRIGSRAVDGRAPAQARTRRPRNRRARRPTLPGGHQHGVHPRRALEALRRHRHVARARCCRPSAPGTVAAWSITPACSTKNDSALPRQAVGQALDGHAQA